MSVTLREYYNTGENSTQADNVVLNQITSRVGMTLHFADGESLVLTDWTWASQHNPQAGDYFGLQGVTENSPRITVSAASIEDFSPETDAHGGHEPVIIVVD